MRKTVFVMNHAISRHKNSKRKSNKLITHPSQLFSYLYYRSIGEGAKQLINFYAISSGQARTEMIERKTHNKNTIVSPESEPWGEHRISGDLWTESNSKWSKQHIKNLLPVMYRHSQRNYLNTLICGTREKFPIAVTASSFDILHQWAYT